MHFFTHSSSSFCSTCPYQRSLFCCNINAMSSTPSLSLSSLLGSLSFSLTPHCCFCCTCLNCLTLCLSSVSLVTHMQTIHNCISVYQRPRARKQLNASSAALGACAIGWPVIAWSLTKTRRRSFGLAHGISWIRLCHKRWRCGTARYCSSQLRSRT